MERRRLEPAIYLLGRSPFPAGEFSSGMNVPKTITRETPPFHFSSRSACRFPALVHRPSRVLPFSHARRTGTGRRLACVRLIAEARRFHRVKRPRFFPKCRAEWPFLARHPACDQYARKQSKADNDRRDRQAPAWASLLWPNPLHQPRLPMCCLRP